MTTTSAEKVVTEKEKMEKRRALGRGLESLLPGPRVVKPAAVDAHPVAENAARVGQPAVVENPHFSQNRGEVGHPDVAVTTQGQPGAAVPTQDAITIYAQADSTSRIPANIIVNVNIADIDKNPFQTRYIDDNDALEELSESIKVSGVIQPVVVRPAEEQGRYVLVMGERRLHASKKAGKTTIPAMVRNLSAQQAAEMTVIENLQREDLNCMEQAEAFRVLAREFQMTQAEIGQRVGLSRTAVANYMRLLKLTQPTMEHLIAGRLTFNDARELLKLEDPAIIEKTAEKVIREQMKFEQIETMVNQMSGWGSMPGMEEEKKKGSGSRWVDPNVRAAQVDLERLLGVRVRIRDKRGKGKIVIEYKTVDDYERVVEALRGKK